MIRPADVKPYDWTKKEANRAVQMLANALKEAIPARPGKGHFHCKACNVWSKVERAFDQSKEFGYCPKCNGRMVWDLTNPEDWRPIFPVDKKVVAVIK